jgi:LPXTG-site transpeptidase (sortase) family protein
VSVLNPTSRSIAELDNALLKGVVRHPDSADLNEQNGNMLILGHSSYLKNVFNKNYQAFNGIQNLKWGDTITLRSRDYEYIYRVDRVYEAKASTVTIPTKSAGQKLTLATCDTFGAKEDRFIVESTLVSKKAL